MAREREKERQINSPKEVVWEHVESALCRRNLPPDYKKHTHTHTHTHTPTHTHPPTQINSRDGLCQRGEAVASPVCSPLSPGGVAASGCDEYVRGISSLTQLNGAQSRLSLTT